MFLTLFAAVFAGLGAAGLAVGLPRLLGRRGPRWLAPAAAGVAIFAFTVWNDYSWFARTSGALPASVSVAQSYEASLILQPWTYLVPRVNRFVAIDKGAALNNPEQPGLVIADVLLVARFETTQRLAHIFDCEGGRRAEIDASVSFGSDGSPEGAEWISAGSADPLITAACAEAQG